MLNGKKSATKFKKDPSTHEGKRGKVLRERLAKGLKIEKESWKTLSGVQISKLYKFPLLTFIHTPDKRAQFRLKKEVFTVTRL